MRGQRNSADARRVAQVNDLRKLPSETEWVEFKVDNYDPNRIGRTISGLSNSARLMDEPFGYMLWGLENKTHRVVGTTFDPYKERRSGQPLELWLRNALQPDINIEFFQVSVLGKQTVLLQVPAATTIPTKFNHIAYIRIGEATPKLSDHPDKEASLLSKLRPFAWERGIAQNYVSADDVLDLLDYVPYFRLTKVPLPDGKSAILEALCHAGIIERDFGNRWSIFNIGGLLFANRLTDFSSIQRKSVRIVHYDGSARVMMEALA